MTVSRLNSKRRFAAVALAFSALAGGCIKDYNGEPVDYGAEVPVEDVIKALKTPAQTVDPSTLKAGNYVHFATTQIIAGGEIVSLISDTGLTITDRREDASSVTFTLQEDRLNYKPGHKSETISRQFYLPFSKSTRQPMPEAGATPAPASGAAFASNIPSRLLLFSVGAQGRVASSDLRVTFHNLRVGVAPADPPPTVRARRACLGLPDCKVMLNRVAFDQVAWRADGPDRVHFEFVITPHVPKISGFDMSLLFSYLPGLYRSCITTMIGVGDGKSKTLLHECQEVDDFLFEPGQN